MENPFPEQSENIAQVITNVRIFDGERLSSPQSVYIDGGKIVSEIKPAKEIDGEGCILLPGLIDAHVHAHELEHLKQYRKWGVTTVLDMATFRPSLIKPLRNLHGLTDIRSAGIPATVPGSLHSRFPGWPKEALLHGPDDAASFVVNRISEGSDYIKIVADTPGPDQATVDALVEAAHKHGKLAVAHASSFIPFEMAQKARVDVVTHVPLNKALQSLDADLMVKENRIAVPTLTMMKVITTNLKIPGRDYAHARESVRALYQAGVPILAGTDANTNPGSPAKVQHGTGLHDELELLVEAGLSNLDALRAATILPAQYFGLHDRGAIKPGLRADLVLVTDNPLEDIKATRSIRRVWCGGVGVETT